MKSSWTFRRDRAKARWGSRNLSWGQDARDFLHYRVPMLELTADVRPRMASLDARAIPRFHDRQATCMRSRRRKRVWER